MIINFATNRETAQISFANQKQDADYTPTQKSPKNHTKNPQSKEL